MQVNVRSVRSPEESARTFVYRILSMYIREMFLHPGEKLAETDVAAELQVSRTPVHDTFARLAREKMLQPVPRGAVVPALDAEAIRMNIWMHRTMSSAVLGELYNHRPASLEPLECCVAEEQQALRGASLVKMARLSWSFHSTMYRMAGRDFVMDAMQRTSVDLYRLLRMLENRSMWSYIVERHSAIVQSLAMHNYEAALQAQNEVFDLLEPLLDESSRRAPQYFT